jgi:hypothetical protein
VRYSSDTVARACSKANRSFTQSVAPASAVNGATVWSTGTGLRRTLRTSSIAAFVAILYSHVENFDLPSNLGSARTTAINAICVASSAAWESITIRRHTARTVS